MSTYLLFFLLGLGGGSVYAILGLGLVLKYRSAGVVDFAQGAVAMYGAYVFIGLRTYGVLELPWIVLPHQITLSHSAACPRRSRWSSRSSTARSSASCCTCWSTARCCAPRR